MQKQLKSMALVVAGLALSAGCQPGPPPPPRMPQELAAASQALADRQPDAAISDANAYLQANPHGPSAAGAHYLLGRAYFMKVATDPAEQRELLQSARSSYELALHDLGNDNTVSDPSLEADIRGELSNVAWYQDDFPATIQQAQIVYNMPGTPVPAKRFLLYRIGAAQQRLGNFDAAQLTFRQVEQRFPGTPEAQAAKVQENRREFYVQLGEFPPGSSPAAALAVLSSRGGPLENIPTSSVGIGTSGRTTVDAGPFNTYPAARQVRDQVLRDFPNAVVVP
jgi:tetratricopeptide (TPR) repeat protein